MLLLTPQRYDFSSKSQLPVSDVFPAFGCCWHHKGTIFQANHNRRPRAFKRMPVVVDTTKVRFFKQITTTCLNRLTRQQLLLTPQRYDFSSKSQRNPYDAAVLRCCCWHHKGTIFQANHNFEGDLIFLTYVVVDTTKVRFFKQITTFPYRYDRNLPLLLTPQRYDFSSKSQRDDYQRDLIAVVVDTTKVRFFKQITTNDVMGCTITSCCWHHKGTIFQANHNW